MTEALDIAAITLFFLRISSLWPVNRNGEKMTQEQKNCVHQYNANGRKSESGMERGDIEKAKVKLNSFVIFH